MDHPQAAPPEQAQSSPDATAIPSTDSGRNLEAAVPAPTQLSPQDSQRRKTPRSGTATLANIKAAAQPALDEPSGTLELPELSPIATSTLRAATYLPTFPAATTAHIDESFDKLLATVHTNRPGDDLDIVRAAWQFCMSQHADQRRASGDPYVVHPLDVGQILAEMKMDSTAIAAGLLHDAVEDTDVSTAEIARRFGEQVAHIVEGVTKLDRIKFANKEDQQAENIRKMLLAMVTDIRVVLIKMADRLHNMRTLGALRPDKQVRIAKETLDIYAPLAHRLGMGKLRGEFEDLAFQYVDPARYSKLAQDVELARNQGGDSFLDKIVARFEAELTRHGLPSRVEYRIKRLYSINQKLVSNLADGGDDDIAQVHDLFAVRVITQTVQDCYAILGLLHSIWRPVPGRIKDFIAMPRPNLYQSLHTTLVAEGGYQFEVQIRTEDMHRIAEDGIAAHWKYKANETVSAKDEQRLAWVRQLMEWQKEMTDPNEFMSTLKIDLYPEEVYTFTPKGKVVVLPKDSTPIDFAYTVHTGLGHSTIGAKVNGRIVPLRHRLRNGDIVEIAKQEGHTPSRDWLSFVKSSRARNKIKHWLNEHQRERAMEIGRKLLEREARKFKASLAKLTDADYDRVANDYGLGAGPDLLSAIGFGKYSARQALNKLIPGSTKTAAESETDTEAKKPEAGPGNTIATMSDAVKRVYFGKGSDALQVEGQGDLLVYRARCCNPIRGEEIIGYVTRGKGVAVHARSCPNVQNLLYESDRRITVEWAPIEPTAKPVLGADGKPMLGPDGKPAYTTGDKPVLGADGKPMLSPDGKPVYSSGPNGKPAATPKPTRYPVRLIILCDERSGMLKELTAIISDDDTNIRSVASSANEDGTTATIDFVVETLDLRHLNKLTVDMRKVPGVREVQRVSKL